MMLWISVGGFCPKKMDATLENRKKIGRQPSLPESPVWKQVFFFQSTNIFGRAVFLVF